MRVIFLLLSVLSFSSFAEVTRDTQWQDVPDTTLVGAVVDLGAGGSGGVTLAQVTNVAGRVTSNVVTKAYVEGLGIEAGVSAQTVTGIVSSASVTNAGAVAAAKDYVDSRGYVIGGSAAWTNQVAAIVTNNSAECYSPWSVGNVSTVFSPWYSNAYVRADHLYDSYWNMYVCCSYDGGATWSVPIPTPCNDVTTGERSTIDSVSIFCVDGELRSTRTFYPSTNTLGLAYISDVTLLTSDLNVKVESLDAATNNLTSSVSALATATNNLTASVSSKADKLTGAAYDFNYGTNFTLRLYETLTNVIDRMGGSITNPPTFDYN